MERYNSETIDQAFSDAFFEKEMAPPPHVWANVREGVLIPPSRKSWLLAAAVISVMSVASFLFYNQVTESNVSNTTVQNEAQNASNPELVLADKPEENVEKELQSQVTGSTTEGNQIHQEEAHARLVDLSDAVMTGNDRVRIDDAGIVLTKQDWDLEDDGTQIALSMVPFWKKMPNNSPGTGYWAQAGFGAGNSGTIDGMSASMDASVAEMFLDGSSVQAIETTSEIEGTSFSTGVSAGMGLGRKWIAEAGLAFNTSRLQGTTNAIESVDGYKLPVYFQPRFDGDLAFVSPFTISSNLQFLSVPVRVGYRIIDRKVGWLVTSGVASNFLVKQSIESAAYDNFNVPKESSPFRRAYLSGTVGTEVYVGFASYQLGLNSQLGTALSNLTKPEASFDLKPSFWQIGLNIRYIFK